MEQNIKPMAAATDEDSIEERALQALKDILNASDNGQPYTFEELEGFVLPILNDAYTAGYRLNGEE